MPHLIGADRQPGQNVHTIETTDPSEARRCRYAQFGGRATTLNVHGADVTGMVRHRHLEVTGVLASDSQFGS
jgi:hypothetical protein